MHLGDTLAAEAGSDAVIGRMGGQSPSTAAAVLPFASIEWRVGNSTAVSYRMVTMTAPVAPNLGVYERNRDRRRVAPVLRQRRQS